MLLAIIIRIIAFACYLQDGAHALIVIVSSTFPYQDQCYWFRTRCFLASKAAVASFPPRALKALKPAGYGQSVKKFHRITSSNSMPLLWRIVKMRATLPTSAWSLAFAASSWTSMTCSAPNSAVFSDALPWPTLLDVRTLGSQRTVTRKYE